MHTQCCSFSSWLAYAMTASGHLSSNVSMHCSYSCNLVWHRTWALRPATVSSESSSRNGIMELTSNEGPQMRDYEQKSEILWNEASQIKTQHTASFKMIKSHFDTKKEENAILEDRNWPWNTCTELLNNLKFSSSLKNLCRSKQSSLIRTLSWGYDQHVLRDICTMLCMCTCNTERPWVVACPTRRNKINKLWHILYGTSQNCQNYISKGHLRRTKQSQNVLRQIVHKAWPML